ncbi:MAG: S8 family serine peptidase [Paludibacteraceae bacterium]|nr:S8 family serine peptidase [Paludibacteraceae bacterium]
MKHLFFVFLLLSFLSSVVAQQYRAMYFVFLHDKANTPYSLAAPQDFLSQRAIDRRERLNIPIDSADIPINRAYVSQITATGATFYHASRWMNGLLVYASDNQLQDILALSFVDSAEMVRPAIAPASKPARTKPLKSANDTPVEDSQNVQIGADSLHYAGFRGQDVQIAVIDAGFPAVNTMPGFDSLRNRGGILGTYDFVNDTTNVYHEHYHGTMVLSTMAYNDPKEFVGTAPDADYWLFISEANGDLEEYLYESDLLAIAFEAADSVGADIITASLGYFYTEDNNPDFNYANMNGRFFRSSRAATMAAERGIILCIAAGNEGADPWYYIDTPADADSILCIGGVDPDGYHSYFSSYGPSSDGRIKPELCARATFATVAEPFYGSLTYSNGTSFATPISAGAIASLLSALPGANPAVVRHTLLETASQAENPDNALGYGILNVWHAYNKLKEEPLSVDEPTARNFEASFNDGYLNIENYSGPFSLYDITGKLILTDTYESPLYIPSLAHGLYLLQLPSATIKIIW